MKPQGITISWQGVVVGYMLSYEIDNWNIYGKWQPAQSTLTEEFLNRLAREEELHIMVGGTDAYLDGESQVTKVGGTSAYLDSEPQDTIEFRLL